MIPGTVDCIFCDAHIYMNQIDGVDEQLSRSCSDPPRLSVKFKDRNDFHTWRLILENWKPQPNINFGEVEA